VALIGAQLAPMSESPDTSTDSTLRLLAPGERVFGRFVLDRILGRGGMGVVWKAHDDTLEKEVALKFILESHARDPEAVVNLKRETRRCQELRHAGIVAIYDLHQERERVAVSMEYVVGETLALAKAERPGGCFDPEDILPWLGQLEAALTYAHHEARVVHRDLKPSNLILTHTGRVKVMDFGISQPLAETLGASASTRAEGISLPYGSPQQLIGDRARVADDVYSFAATIYDLITGRPPFFRGKMDLQIMEVIPPPMSERREELRHLGAPIPRSWEETIAAALAKEPGDRPASIAELVRSLREGWVHRGEPEPVVKISVPKTDTTHGTRALHGSPAPKEPHATTRLPEPKERVVSVGWVPSPVRRKWRIRDAGLLTTAGMVIVLAAFAAFCLHFIRHSPSPASTAKASPAPVAAKAPPDPLRPASIQATGAKPPPKTR
jgi:serine/threonine protein kinase